MATRTGRNGSVALTLLLAGAACLPACAGRAAPHVAPSLLPVTRIVFVGDSLVHRSASDYGMLDAVRDRLARRFPSRAFEVLDAGVNGDRIADIRQRLEEDVVALRPDAVVLYWDSDVSDVDESDMAPDDVHHLRAAYERDVVAVLERLVASGAYVVMSGPTLLGERPHHGNEKDAQLDFYRDLNRRIAAEAEVRYIDTRRAFQAGRPAGSPATADRGLLTEDGEHLNARGANLAGSMFEFALAAWLRRQPSIGTAGAR
jgi:isoamyl acetate esterase